jgi:phospholipid-binding lipoprotein MlaA
MTGMKLSGLLLIACVLLMGCSHAGNAPKPGALAERDAMTVQTQAATAGPADGTVSGKQSLSGDDVSEAGSAPDPNTGTSPDAKADPGAEADGKTEAVQESDYAANAEVAPGEEKPEEAGPGIETPSGEANLEQTIPQVTIADPIEPWNRLMFHFNDKLYFWVMKPVARGYNVVVPEPVRISVRNFFRNVAMPIRFVNSLLQGKFKGAGSELARFLLNSTVGLAGFFDVATSRFKLDPSREDLGQTLGFYGMPGLMYIVWPFLGPSTVRDSIGLAGDGFMYPVNYISPWEAALGVNAYERVNTTSLELGNYENLIESALEPYIAVRDAYIQYRKAQIKK